MLNPLQTRRRFLGTSALGAGAVISGSTAIQMLSTVPAWADAAGDLDIANFALTLEYLEADFYAQGSTSVKFANAAETAIIKLIAADEAAHVTALADTITKAGGKPVAKPKITYPAGTFESRDKFLALAHTFEEVGVGAYLGQAGLITSPDILQAAVAIFGIECRHAALIGKLAALPPEGGVYSGSFEKPKTKDEVLAAVKPLLS